MPSRVKMPARRFKNGRLASHDLDRVLRALAQLIYVEGKTLTNTELGEAVGVSRNSIPKLLAKLHDREERDKPTLVQLRQSLLSRLEVQYGRSVETYTAARAEGDLKAAIDSIRAGSDALAKAGKIAGLESQKPTEAEGGNRFRIIMEGEWGDGAPVPAAAVAAARRVAQLPTASGTEALPQSAGADEGNRSGAAVGQGRVLPDRATSAGDGMLDMA